MLLTSEFSTKICRRTWLLQCRRTWLLFVLSCQTCAVNKPKPERFVVGNNVPIIRRLAGMRILYIHFLLFFSAFLFLLAADGNYLFALHSRYFLVLVVILFQSKAMNRIRSIRRASKQCADRTEPSSGNRSAFVEKCAWNSANVNQFEPVALEIDRNLTVARITFRPWKKSVTTAQKFMTAAASWAHMLDVYVNRGGIPESKKWADNAWQR